MKFRRSKPRSTRGPAPATSTKPGGPPRRSLPDRFLRRYYDVGSSTDWGKTWKGTYWMGTLVRKLPMDLWLYQEIIHEVRPDVLIECGTAFGGSAHYFANLFDLVGNGKVITVDIDDWDVEVPGYHGRPQHERITYVKGSSTDPEIVERVRAMIPEGASVMVVLDSDHSRDHVFNELTIYSDFVTPGSMLVVEDTFLNGHPCHDDFGPGPMEALEDYLKTDDRFVDERLEERHLISFNPKGYLRRKS